MPLRLSRPKNSPNWYIGGTVKVGDKKTTQPRISTGVSDKERAESIRIQVQREIEEALLYGKKRDTSSQVSLHYACDQWAKQSDPDKADVTVGRQLLKRLGENTTLEDVTRARWLSYRSEHMQGKKPATVYKHKMVLRAWFHAVGATPPELPVPKNKHERVRWLTIEDANRLLNAYPQAYKGPATFARYGGLRANEIARLELTHINWDAQTIELPASLNKNRKTRQIPMHPKMLAVAQGCLENDSGFVFERGGEPFPYDTYSKKNPFYRAHVGACKRAGIEDFTFHDWRHHWAFWMVRNGLDIRTLQRVAGWGNLEQAAKYLAPSFDDAKEVMKVVK